MSTISKCPLKQQTNIRASVNTDYDLPFAAPREVIPSARNSKRKIQSHRPEAATHVSCLAQICLSLQIHSCAYCRRGSTSSGLTTTYVLRAVQPLRRRISWNRVLTASISCRSSTGCVTARCWPAACECARTLRQHLSCKRCTSW